MAHTSLKRIFPLLLLLTVAGVSRAQDEPDPVHWSSAVQEVDNGLYDIRFTARIDSPWHLYDIGPYDGGPNATHFKFNPGDSCALVGAICQETKPSRKFDPLFGMEIGTFTRQAVFVQRVKLVPPARGAQITVQVEWMACSETSCLPPDEYDFTITVGDPPLLASTGTPTTPSADDTPDNGCAEGSLWSAIIAAILWGFAALLTPCVFPMVPMTISFFLKGSEDRTRGRLRASLYGLCIVLLYTVPIAVIILITRIVGGETVTADIFNWLATHWIPNLLFFLVFMIFAVSFLGAFEITLPGWLVNKSDSKADRGGIVGLFFMALTLVLVSFSCTGPIVGSVLIKSTSGEVWAPVITMFAFSVAFALPFTLFALFPSLLNKLPKSGGWLNSVKVVLGFLELALGLKFLSVADQTYHWGILDREVYLALWIAMFSLLGLYLLGKLHLAHDSKNTTIGVPRLLLSILTFAFVIYMLPGMWGAPLKGLSGYLPPIHTQDFVGGLSHSTPSATSPEPARPHKHSDFLTLPHGLPSFFDYDEALDYARSINKPLLVDYTGHGCVNCREMEARVWADPEVLTLLRNDFVIVALYSDDKKVLPRDEWVTTETGKVLKSLGKINAHLAHQKFGINSQPYYLILDGNGEQLVPGRGYNLSVPGFVQFLKNGVEQFRVRQATSVADPSGLSDGI